MESLLVIIEYLKNYQIWNNSAWAYTLALFVFLGSVIVLKIFQVIILKKLDKLAKKTKTDLDDMLVEIFEGIKPPFYFLFSAFVALRYLSFSDTVNNILFVALIIVITLEIAQAFNKLVDFYTKKYINKSDREEGDKKQAKAMMRILRGFAVVIIWVSAILIILSNLGVNITSLVASLGIGGIAIALAVQNVLGDILSSFSLFIDKPFQVGDKIVIGTDSGTVERIGLKTTRLKTLRGEELIVSNKELTTVRVQNMKKLEKRREVFRLGVTYDTPKKKLEKIPDLIKNIVSKHKMAEFGRCIFVEYADSSLIFEVVFNVNTPEMDEFLRIKHAVNLEIYSTFEKEKIEFAYPTQTIYTKKS